MTKNDPTKQHYSKYKLFIRLKYYASKKIAETIRFKYTSSNNLIQCNAKYI